MSAPLINLIMLISIIKLTQHYPEMNSNKVTAQSITVYHLISLITVQTTIKGGFMSHNIQKTAVISPNQVHDNVEQEVLRRYKAGALNVEAGLCCPTCYEPELLEILPGEILEKDYGCGDPTVHVYPGEKVLDLGSGAGKICYMLAKKVGPAGEVIGVDFNDEMLKLARKYIPEMASKLGYENVRFVKARIQDLALDMEVVEDFLSHNPVRSLEELSSFDTKCEKLRKDSPLIIDDSVDVVVSNCVLNLVKKQGRERLFQEIYRVLRLGGRAVISDIVCDEDPTPAILQDPELWSGCIAGAFREDQFLEKFEQAGFYGIEVVSYQSEPWKVIDGIEFRSVTVRAFKGKEGRCYERNQAVIYKGPWKSVTDDDGHVLYRGKRMAVCDKTYQLMTSPTSPYSEDIVPVPPLNAVPLEEAGPFSCKEAGFRNPRQTKGESYQANITSTCCGINGPC